MRTKALQWQKTSDTVLCWAHTVLGSYRVWKIGADGEWDWSFEGYDTRETFIGKVPTEEAARAAAQSHFDAAIASVLEDDWQTMEGQQFPSLDEAYDAAVRAVAVFDDAANVEETNWTGWGDQDVPASATMRRVKAGHALSALRDADPRRRFRR